MRLTDERDNLLKSLEECNCELARAFENYRKFNKNTKVPKINDDEGITPEEGAVLVDIYWNHREALENIRKCGRDVKKAVLKLEAYFNGNKEIEKKIKKIFNEREKKEQEKQMKKI